LLNVIKEERIIKGGPEKNTKNKVCDTKLLNRKTKLQQEKRKGTWKVWLQNESKK
jgi:hypothetical protein